MQATYVVVTICRTKKKKKKAQAVGNMYKFLFQLHEKGEPLKQVCAVWYQHRSLKYFRL